MALTPEAEAEGLQRLFENLVVRVENLASLEFGENGVDESNSAQMQTLKEMTELIIGQELPGAKAENQEALVNTIQNEVLKNAREAAASTPDVSEVTATVAAIDPNDPFAELEAGIIESKTPEAMEAHNEFTQNVLEDVAERMGGEESKWDADQVKSTLGTILAEENLPEDQQSIPESIREAFEVSVSQVLDESNISVPDGVEMERLQSFVNAAEENTATLQSMENGVKQAPAYENVEFNNTAMTLGGG